MVVITVDRPVGDTIEDFEIIPRYGGIAGAGSGGLRSGRRTNRPVSVVVM